MRLKILNCAKKNLLTPCHSKKLEHDHCEVPPQDHCYDEEEYEEYLHSQFYCRTKNRCKGCDHNVPLLSSSAQYQRLKIIQNTVRVPSSLYSMNIGALTVFQRPTGTDRVNWNQMSDRIVAHKQAATVSMKSSVSIRPGNMSPGGVGCDIKHNSYNRYLARLKGSRPLRKDKLPENYGVEHIPFSLVMPVYGGKLVKTSIGTNTCELN
jgi:hypothetical protein